MILFYKAVLGKLPPLFLLSTGELFSSPGITRLGPRTFLINLIAMRKILATILMTLGLSGCTVPEMSPPPPEMIPIADSQCAWEAVADVIDDYFKIEHEEPVRKIGDTYNEGRIDTFYQVSPTILEPWRRDTAGEYERVENTLQTMRRRAVVRVWSRPNEGGHWVDVAVFKELEDLPKPEHASAGGATFRYDSSFTRVVNPAVMDPLGECWIPQGRDPVLEQRIIGHILSNCNELGYNMQMQGPGFGTQDSGFGVPDSGFGVQDYKKSLPPGGTMQ